MHIFHFIGFEIALGCCANHRTAPYVIIIGKRKIVLSCFNQVYQPVLYVVISFHFLFQGDESLVLLAYLYYHTIIDDNIYIYYIIIGHYYY